MVFNFGYGALKVLVKDPRGDVAKWSRAMLSNINIMHTTYGILSVLVATLKQVKRNR